MPHARQQAFRTPLSSCPKGLMFTSIAHKDAAFAILSDPNLDPLVLYEEGLLRRQAEEPVRLPGVHASEISKCLRMVRFSLNGASKVPPRKLPKVDLKKRFAIGHAVHELVQAAYAKGCGRSVRFEPEVELADTPLGRELNLRSKTDGVITHLDSSGQPFIRIGLEIKTDTNEAWQKRVMPDEDHLDQVTVYMAALDLPLMYISYVNKSSGECTPFKAPFAYVFDEARWKSIRARIERASSEENPFNLPAASKSSACMTCSYRHHCKDSNEPLPKTFVWEK